MKIRHLQFQFVSVFFFTPVLSQVSDKIGCSHNSFSSFQITGSCLRNITDKTKHSVNIWLKISRDSYATTLKLSGKSRDEIGEMMGQSNSHVTKYCLVSADMDKTNVEIGGLLR